MRGGSGKGGGAYVYACVEKVKQCIEIDGGEGIGRRTLNEKLGIVGGITILGTSGIVEPMSERALIDTIHAEISMYSTKGQKDLIITPTTTVRFFCQGRLGWIWSTR